MKVTILVAEHCSAASVSASLEALCCANMLTQAATASLTEPFEVITASLDGKPVTCSGGLTLVPSTKISQVDQTELIIVPGFLFEVINVLPKLKDLYSWLRLQYSQGAVFAAMCTGTFVLAEAGILNNKHVTTHWFFVDEFKKRYPEVKVEQSSTLTDDGNVICSGGAASGNEMLLHLIKRFCSSPIASECSKKLLIDAQPRLQTPYMLGKFSLDHGDTRIEQVQRWLNRHYMEDVKFEDLGASFGFGKRNFTERFKKATGVSPVQYLQNLRIEKAKTLLESTDRTLEEVTCQVGYSDVSSFRALFKKKVGISLKEYRNKFLFSET